jgi:hypothetical protein
MNHENFYRKTLPIPVIVLVAILATPADAAVSYEFKQVSQSDFQNSADGEVTGSVIIEGEKSRVELLRGSGHPVGTYIISRNDSQLVFVVDPVNKKYTEINAAKIGTAFGSGRIQITNLKTNLTKLPDHPMVAGFPTDHYRMTTSYDIMVMFGSLPLKQAVVTVIDKWVTTAFGELTDAALTRTAGRTGNEAVDQLIETELGRIKGFPLRQVTIIQTSSEAVASTRSKLKLNPTRKQTTELTITRIAPTVADASVFEVPASFAKVDASSQPEGPVSQMLTMTP